MEKASVAALGFSPALSRLGRVPHFFCLFREEFFVCSSAYRRSEVDHIMLYRRHRGDVTLRSLLTPYRIIIYTGWSYQGPALARNHLSPYFHPYYTRGLAGT